VDKNAAVLKIKTPQVRPAVCESETDAFSVQARFKEAL
jgi:hypothetical protein